MALKILITISKKVPGAQDYSSIQASCSIEGELAPGQDPAVEASRLQTQAQQAVDQFLGITPATSLGSPPPANHRPVQYAANSPRPGARSPTPNGQSTRPYADNRRTPAPVTDNQLRFIERLLAETQTDLGAVLHHHQVGSLRQLTCKAAAQLIDELRSGARR